MGGGVTPTWFVAMCAFYAVALAFFVTALVRVVGPRWRTSGRWLLAGWVAYAVGLTVSVAGLAVTP